MPQSEIIGQRQFHHLRDFPDVEIRRHADHAFGPDRHEGQRERVVAAQHGEVAAKRLLQLVDAIDAVRKTVDDARATADAARRLS